MQVFQLRKEGHLEEALELYKKVLKENKNSIDKKELVNIYVQSGNILSNLSRIKESFEYLERAMESNQELQDTEIAARIYGEYGRNYMALGFNQKAIEYFTKGIDLSRNIVDAKARNTVLQYLYSTRGVIYEESNQLDALYQDLHSAYKVIPDTYSASRLAKYFTVHRENLDSAKFYLKKGEEMFSTGKFPIFQKSILLRSYGRFYFQKKNYEKAISYYKQSLAISEELNKPKDIKDTHKLLYESYKAVNDDKNAGENLEQYSRISDSLSSEHKKIQETPIKHILKEKQEEVIEKERSYLFIFFIIFVLIIVAVYLVLKRISKFNKKEKQEIISENETKTQELKLKVNESFDEVIQLAKSNSPEFWGRFQEVYPDFRTKLLSRNPDLKPSELTLSAYIYLGFATKDIAEYTFKAVKTIKNNKYNLRKRLDIPTEHDFTIWIRNYLS
ncbi:tetratricopeptide repeat protein [Chryseobacterium sp. KACC 21268]|nr:tetratricopeptide repeat protein [Chryseobacterium sp. KACC 21268]